MEESWLDDYRSFPADEDKLLKIKKVREAFMDLASVLQDLLPAGRSKSTVRTTLEKASMFAVSAIVKG
jgi:hypothetical protein